MVNWQFVPQAGTNDYKMEIPFVNYSEREWSSSLSSTSSRSVTVTSNSIGPSRSSSRSSNSN